MDAWKDAKEIESRLARQETVTIHFNGKEEASKIMDALCYHGYPTDGYTIDEDETDIDKTVPTCYITKRYDINGALREAINESAGFLLNSVSYYDEQERLVYVSSYEFVGGHPGFYIIERTCYTYDKSSDDGVNPVQARRRKREYLRLKLVFDWGNDTCTVSHMGASESY